MAGIAKERIVCSAIVKVIFSTITLAILYFAQRNITYFKESYEGIIDNWNQPLINGFSNDSFFDAKTEEIDFWKGQYPGTVEGCDCPYSDSESNVQRGLHRHICSYNESSNDCRSIFSVASSRFHYWGSPDIVKVRNLKGSTFSELAGNMDSDGKCRAGFKRCGSVNSISKGICIPSGWSQCPITDIHIGQSNPDPSYWTETTTFNGYSIYASRNYSNNPVADLKIGEHEMCENPKEYGITPGRKVYTLYAGSTSQCVRDTRYNRLDEQGELTLFMYNQVDFKSLTRFSTSDNYKWARFYRRVIEWKPECLQEISTLNSMESSLKTTNTTCLVMTILSFITIIACALIHTGEAYAVLKDKPYSEDEMWMVAKIKTFISSLTIPFLVAIVLMGKPLLEYFTGIEAKRCSDDFTNHYFSGLRSSLERDVFYLNITSLIIGILVLTVDAADVIWTIAKRRQHRIEVEAEAIAPLEESQARI